MVIEKLILEVIAKRFRNFRKFQKFRVKNQFFWLEESI